MGADESLPQMNPPSRVRARPPAAAAFAVARRQWTAGTRRAGRPHDPRAIPLTARIVHCVNCEIVKAAKRGELHATVWLSSLRRYYPHDPQLYEYESADLSLVVDDLLADGYIAVPLRAEGRVAQGLYVAFPPHHGGQVVRGAGAGAGERADDAGAASTSRADPGVPPPAVYESPTGAASHAPGTGSEWRFSMSQRQQSSARRLRRSRSLGHGLGGGGAAPEELIETSTGKTGDRARRRRAGSGKKD